MRGMKSIGSREDELMLWANLATAVAYYVITSQLLLFVYNPKVVKIFYASDDAKDGKKRHIFRLLLAVAILFASFIALCGTSHLLNVMLALHPRNASLKTGFSVVMWSMTVVSFFTAIVGFRLFPSIADAVKGFELNNDGKLQLAESYLIEVVDLIKESILVLSEDLVVMKCNDVSKLLFGELVIGSNICQYIHADDLPQFKDAVLTAVEGYSCDACTLEVRVLYVPPPTSSQSNTPTSNKPRRKKSHYKIYSTDEPLNTEADIDLEETTPLHAETESRNALDEYIWIEVTLCKGRQTKANGAFENDIKLVCRNIDDRKKRQVFQTLIECTEERGRINESKLRYVSCVAHDLKTPLQSFTFSLDLLSHSELNSEQREFVDHATVAIDLMKLTISQTMDISKALTGAKLMPRRTTVYLSSVLNRVKIIINGYGKQVPVSFEVAPDVCDEIITDEEWLWQMLLNLLTNACKYTDRGSIIVRVSITQERRENATFTNSSMSALSHTLTPLIMANCARPMLLCEVLDTGVGISPDKIRHIFDAFAQVQEGQVTGTGLGLFGVRTRAEGLLGTCGARHNTESSTGTGIVLWFAVPYTPDVDGGSVAGSVSSSSTHSQKLALHAFQSLQTDFPHVTDKRHLQQKLHETIATDTNDVASCQSSGAISANVGTHEAKFVPTKRRSSFNSINQSSAEILIRALKLTAMVVEDTPTVRKLMQKLLLSMGFASVTCYENGSKGLEAMMVAPVDIVFSDVQMPIMTGPEMVSRFRKWELNQASVVSTPKSDSCSTSNAFIPASEDSKSTKNALFPPRHIRQLIVAVTANGEECSKENDGGFDEICPKPLTRADIYCIVNRHFRFEL